MYYAATQAEAQACGTSPAAVVGGGNNDEVTGFRWADEATIRQLTSEAYAVRLLDALRSGTTPVIRHHDGTNLL